MKKLGVGFVIVVGVILTGAGVIVGEFESVAVGMIIGLWGVAMTNYV